MNAYRHAVLSAKKWGGKAEDYQPIHDLIDCSKQFVPDVRHRALFHNAFGPFLCEKVFGHFIVNSDGKEIPTREIAEKHIIEDMGYIPQVTDWFKGMPIETWMGGPVRRTKETITFPGGQKRSVFFDRPLQVHGTETDFSGITRSEKPDFKPEE